MSLNSLNSKTQDLRLRTKVTAGVVLPLIIILGILTFVEYKRHQKAVLTNLNFLASETNHLLESSLLHEMVNRDIVGLQEMLNALGEEQSIRSIFLLDTTGKIIFAPFAEKVGTQLDIRDPTCQPCHMLEATNRPGSVIVTLPDGQRVFRTMNPIENRAECFSCHDPNQRINGLLLTDILMEPLEGPLKADFSENILWRVASILVTIIVVNLVMSKVVVRRLEVLAQAFERFGKRNLDLQSLNSNQDEIGQLFISFKNMGKRIQAEEAENLALSEDLKQQSALRGELLKRLTTAQEDERKRVARELHDELGQALSSLSINMEVFEALVPSENNHISQQLKQMRRMIKETTDNMYDLIFALRPSILDDLGLIPALHAYADRMLNGTGISFNVNKAHISKRLPPEIETTLYRIFQEAINNAIRYANASKILVTLAHSIDFIHGEILDDGIGFEPENVSLRGDSPHGFGLLGMKERITQCNGQLEIFSQPGRGTCIRIHIPLDDKKFN